jgi:hypothetical protein
MALLVKTDGTQQEVTPASAIGKFTLEELQKLVGGYIEYVSTGEGTGFLCNEDGLMLRLPVNQKATDMWLHRHWRVLVGDVVFVENLEI